MLMSTLLFCTCGVSSGVESVKKAIRAIHAATALRSQLFLICTNSLLSSSSSSCSFKDTVSVVAYWLPLFSSTCWLELLSKGMISADAAVSSLLADAPSSASGCMTKPSKP